MMMMILIDNRITKHKHTHKNKGNMKRRGGGWKGESVSQGEGRLKEGEEKEIEVINGGGLLVAQ